MRFQFAILAFISTVCAVYTSENSNFHSTNVKRASSGSGSMSTKPKLIPYVVDWAIPKKIDWSKMDHIAYAFAEPNEAGALKSFTPSILKSTIASAHKNNVGVSISVGGWSGSKYFSSLVGSSSGRATFLKNIMAMVETYSLDGVNLDWEYPNDPNGISSNIKNKDDTANYLIFLTALRKALDTKYPKAYKLITLAVSTAPFNDANQKPSKKLAAGWAEVVDYYYIMDYDISGTWMSNAAPASALDSNGDKYDSSVVASVKEWSAAGIPKSRIVVGVPFYGTSLETAEPITSSSGMYVKLAKGSKEQDEFEWKSIASEGVLSNKGGWASYWDKISNTPYAYDASKKNFLSFDDPRSMKLKVDYVNTNGLGGIMLWSLDMDDPSGSLLESLQGVRKSGSSKGSSSKGSSSKKTTTKKTATKKTTRKKTSKKASKHGSSDSCDR